MVEILEKEKGKKVNKLSTILCAIFLCLVIVSPACGQVRSEVEWPQFLGRHDLVWTQSPQAWHDGPFMGNGMLGTMLHQIEDRTFRISLGRSDVEDHQTRGSAFLSQSRLPIGYFTLKTLGKVIEFSGRLDLYNAETTATVKTDKGTVKLRAFVHSDQMLIVYESAASGNESVRLEFVPLKAIAPARYQAELAVKESVEEAPKSRKRWAEAPYTYNPAPVLANRDGIQTSRQLLEAGGETGTAWTITGEAGSRQELRVSIEHSFPKQTATDDAVANLKNNTDQRINELIKSHRTWWHNYYPKSFLSIDDTRMESFYWIQVYKFASGARKGRAFMDTMGPWIVENTAWASGWFNLNTQLSYWFLATANRFEVAESLFTKLDEKLPTLVANMPEKYGDDCAGMSTIVPQTFISRFPAGKLGFTGELLWTCHDYWLMLERTMDEDRTTNKFYPLLRKAVNTYLHVMVEGDDSKIHLPHTRSPEYGGGEDCNFNLALFRWGCRTLIEIDERYEIDDALLPKWKDVVARLVDYPADENGYMVAKDFPFAKSHRHYSHLLMIYPLCEVNIDQPENRKLIADSVDHWINYPGTGNAGYSFSGAAAMYALQGDGETAGKYLDTFMQMQILFPKSPGKIWPTTMYTETSRIQPVTETPLSLCDSMQLMLLQSWGDTIRVFPAVPKAWENVSFSGMLAKGGFEISASRRNGKTDFVAVKSNAGQPCLLKLDFEPKRIEGIDRSAVTKGADGRWKVGVSAGESVVFYANDVGDAFVKPVEGSVEKRNSFGLNSFGL